MREVVVTEACPRCYDLEREKHALQEQLDDLSAQQERLQLVAQLAALPEKAPR